MASSQDAVVRRHLADAARAGPYLWSEEDVSNALLWFRHSKPSSSTPSSSFAGGGDDANRTAAGGDGKEEGCEFLRRLLHARGTTMPRPPKQKRKKKESTTEKDSASGKTTRRKRSKKGEPKVAFPESSPLQAVMMGYYQLMLPPETSNASGGDAEDSHEEVQFTTQDIQKAEMASSQLLDDLSTIVSARRHTNDLYQAFANVANREGGDEGSGSIDEYMTRPSTCTLRVYASNIFDRLLDLCPRDSGAAATDADVNGADGDDGSNPALERYLQKLFGMAPTNVKIREVILLLLLEPVRRLQLQRQQSKQPQPLSEQLIPEPRERRQQSPSTHLSPMLLSSCWVDIPPETVERECSRPPLPALIASILNTSRRIDKPSVDSNGSTPTVDWWTLPSPLLCAASQLHLGLALEYIRYWIDKALAGHGELYDIQSSLVAASGTEEEDSFQHATQRIKQFLSTSERLNLLGYHVLRSVEKESQESFDACSLDDDEADAAFRKPLAWKAIYRAIAVSKAPGFD